jgi:glycerate 2-kinase
MPTAIDDRDRLANTPARETALACITAGIEAARPQQALRERVTVDGTTLQVGEGSYDLNAFDEVRVLGGGKAAVGVAEVIADLLGDRVSGTVVAPVDDAPADPNEDTGAIDVLPGDHPIPSERGVESARRVLALANAADEHTLVLAVVTGGASALLPAPAAGLSLADLRAVTETLLDSGATIAEINAVRKHCSSIKGGLLARRAAPATVASVLLSDVVGDDPGTIGSGPTAPDETTFEAARSVLDRYDIDAPAVADRLREGAAGDIDDTPGADDPAFDRVTNRVLAGAHTAIDAAATVAAERGYASLVLSSTLRGEASDLGVVHAAVAEECLATGMPVAPPAVVLSGGEATVTVRGEGRGGPNGELALAAAIELRGDGGRVALCSVDTDGHDGGSDAAGALVDADTLAGTADSSGGDARRQAREALAENDTDRFLDGRDALVRTGSTGTNVNDLRALVIERA